MTSRPVKRCAATIQIDRFSITDRSPVFIVAEIGVNHNGNLQLAREMTAAAKQSGADAVKFQTFQTEQLVTKTAAMAAYQVRNTGVEESQFEMLKRLELSERDHQVLADDCRKLDLLFLSTPFDSPSVALLRRIGVAAFKISSSDTDNFPLLTKVAAEHKPVILSTGMSRLDEIETALDVILPQTPEVIVLQCTSEYPCPPEDTHLAAMAAIRARFGCLVGFSDHTVGPQAAVIAAALGAVLVEKHFTIDRTLPGPDQAASALPAEFSEMVRSIRALEQMPVEQREQEVKKISHYEAYLGSAEKNIAASVTASGVAQVAKRSIVAARSIPRGTVILEDMLVMKRPGTGLSAEHYFALLGTRAARDIEADELLSWADVERPSEPDR